KEEPHEQDSQSEFGKPFENLPPDRYLRLRKGKVTASTLGANLGDPRIRVQTRTKLYVIAPSAEIAEDRFSSRHAAAFITIFHRFPPINLISGSRSSPTGRSQTEAKRPSRRTASKLVNQKIFRVFGATALRIESTRRSDGAITSTRKGRRKGSPGAA